MTFLISGRFAVLKGILLLLFTMMSPVAFAISDFVRTQSPQHVAALIYGLLGIMAILFITPLLQFYFGAVREVSHKQALDEQAQDAPNTDASPAPNPFHTTNATLERLFDAAPLGMGKLNSKHEIVSANPGFIQRLGFSESELKKGNIYKLFSDVRQAEECAETLHTHQTLNKKHVELTNKAGEAFPAELTIMPTDASDEEYVFWMVNYSDEHFQYDKFNPLLENTDHELAQTSSTITSLKDRLTEQEKKIASMALQREAEEHEASALLSQIDSLKQALHEKTQKLELLEYQIDRLEAEQENATDFINQLTRQLNTQGKSGEAADNAAATTNAESETVTLLRSQFHALTTDTLQEKQRLLDAKNKADTQLVRAKAALSKTSQQLSELTQSRQQIAQENSKQSDLIDDLMNQLATLRQDHKKQQAQLVQLQQAREAGASQKPAHRL